MKRSDLLEYMESLLRPADLRRGRSFSHFIRQQGRVVAAEFTNGETEYGDLFIGCDGGNSRVREDLFGSLSPTAVRYKEIVGVTRNGKHWERYGHTFLKFQHDQYGLAFGMIPTGANEFVWFMQYDPCRGDVRDGNAGSIATVLHPKSRKTFRPKSPTFSSENDFTRTYVWNTRDFDLLPTFHKENVVLLGDAAGQALPFSSTGTTNAIVGAKNIVRSPGQLAQPGGRIPPIL